MCDLEFQAHNINQIAITAHLGMGIGETISHYENEPVITNMMCPSKS